MKHYVGLLEEVLSQVAVSAGLFQKTPIVLKVKRQPECVEIYLPWWVESLD